MNIGLEETSLAEHARQCILSFNQCEGYAACLPPQDKAIVEDQAGRFSVWASNIGALAPARASLDYRLREAEDVRRLVMALLITLDESIQEYISQLRSAVVSQGGSHDSASVSSSLGPILQEIADKISLLHQISNLIRKASSNKHNIKAANEFVIRDDTGNDYGPTFRNLVALAIIRQFFPQCPRSLQERLADAMLLRRKQILYRDSRYGKSPLRNTASAPSARTLDYINNQNVTQGVSTTTEPQPGSNTNPARNVASSRAPTATTLDHAQWQKVSTAPSSTGQPTVFQPTQDDKLSFPDGPKKSIRVRLKALKRGREADLQQQLESIPNYDIFQEHNGQPPLEPDIVEQIQKEIETLKTKTDEDIERDEELCRTGSMEATCPYCCCIISSATIMNKNKWADHVRHDIGPYVCLFENCDTPDILFNHSNSWLKHMRQHNKRWCCAAKAHGVLVFETQSEYEQHMAKRHKAMKGQLELLAERQYRSSGQLFQSCPLCGAMNMDTGLERHIASHLVFLALKSLPSFDDGENCGSPDDVSQDSDSESGDSQRRTFPDERLSEQSHISAGDSGPVGDEDDAGSGAPDERSIESPTLSHITIEEFESKAGPGGPESPRGSGNSEPPQVESQVTSSGFLDHDLTLGHDIMVRLPGDTPGQAHQMVASLDTQCKGINLMSSRVWGKLDEEGRGALQSAGDVALRSLSSEKLPVIGVVRGLEWYFKNGFRTYIDDFHIIDMQRFDVLIGSDSIHKNELLMPGLDLQAVTRREGDGLLQPGVGPHQMNKSKGEEGPRRGVRDRIKKWVASSRKDRLSSRDYLD